MEKNPGVERQRKPIRMAVAEIDQEILRLLTRRHNLLAKMRRNGRLEVADEKFLREAWQNDVARVSRDPELSGRFFALMNQVSFLPKPTSEDDRAVSKSRTAFNLAPPAVPAQISLTIPLDANQCRAWLYLAARSGQELRLSPCLQNDDLVDYIQGLAQLGGAVTREGDTALVRPGQLLGTPDKVIFVGACPYNFFLFLAHYLGSPGRVRFNGATALELADFSAIEPAITQMGARLVHIIPHSSGLPVRLESSGLVPPGLTASAQMPSDFLEALLLCSPFYPGPFAIDLTLHPCRDSIMAHVLPILTKTGVTFSIDNYTVNMNPSPVVFPDKVTPPMCTELALFLLALTSALGGEAELAGIWPHWPEAEQIRLACSEAHWQWQADKLSAKYEQPLKAFHPAGPPLPLPPWHKALLTSLAVCSCRHGGSGSLWTPLADDPDVQDFLHICGCTVDGQGQLTLGERRTGLPWNAPTSAWALALAVAACARGEKAGWPLGNPGIITELWPQFWSFYNKLPKARLNMSPPPPAPVAKARRRILTNAVIKPPELKEEDW